MVEHCLTAAIGRSSNSMKRRARPLFLGKVSGIPGAIVDHPRGNC